MLASPPSEPCWRFSRVRLSSRWLSSSGVSRGAIGRIQGEAPPLAHEDGIAPSSAVGRTSPHGGTPVLRAQDGAQPSPDEAIEHLEQEWSGVLEVAEPPPRGRVEVLDNPPVAIAPAAAGLGPYPVLERRLAILMHGAAPRLEPVTQEADKTSSRTHSRSGEGPPPTACGVSAQTPGLFAMPPASVRRAPRKINPRRARNRSEPPVPRLPVKCHGTISRSRTPAVDITPSRSFAD